MTDKPWLAKYDKGVPQTFDVPKVPLFNFLEESARKYPDRACTIFKGAVITFKEMNAITDSVAAALVDMGVEEGRPGGNLHAEHALYDPISYNNGSVWPFLTGFLSWAEYRSHVPLAAFQHWVQNAGLIYSNALGYAPELLSGDFHQPLDTAVPHQLFSSSGILTPLLKGMLGFYPDAVAKVIRLEPHLPSRWPAVEFRGLRVGSGSLAFSCSDGDREVVYHIETGDLIGYSCRLRPGFEAGAEISGVTLNGKPAAFETKNLSP